MARRFLAGDLLQVSDDCDCWLKYMFTTLFPVIVIPAEQEGRGTPGFDGLLQTVLVFVMSFTAGTVEPH